MHISSTHSALSATSNPVSVRRHGRRPVRRISRLALLAVGLSTVAVSCGSSSAKSSAPSTAQASVTTRASAATAAAATSSTVSATASTVAVTAATATTEAPATTTAAPTTTTSGPATTTAATTAFTIPQATTPSGVPFIDPATLLTPWDGQKLVSFSETQAESLVTSITSSGGVSDYLSAVGAVQAVDDTTGKLSVLIFMELKAPLSNADLDSFYQALLQGTTEQEQGTVAGSTGFAFKSSDGEQGFATVRNTTVILGESDDEATLAASVGGLFQANPQL